MGRSPPSMAPICSVKLTRRVKQAVSEQDWAQRLACALSVSAQVRHERAVHATACISHADGGEGARTRRPERKTAAAAAGCWKRERTQ